ncbi:MAG: hypothetical protein GY855_02195 [candidate division Zixibacteria bacterium]|nr:hypothetical protein [candidate division Zixibacteria bacterium]
MSKSLPLNPNLNQLKNQAKDLLKAHQNGESAVCDKLRLLNRFSKKSDSEIFVSKLALNEAQFAIALDYRFSSWDALKKHVEATSPVTNAAIKEENGKVWIDGIPKLMWGKSGECTFAGALSSALSVTKHPCSYDDIMGFTGLAFRFRWYRRTDVPGWCPSSPVGEFPDEVATTSKATGWKFRDVFRMGIVEPHMEQFAEEVIASIDNGIPVLGVPENLDIAIIYGYQRNGDDINFIWNGYHWNEPHILNQTKTGPFIIFLEEHTQPEEKKKSFIESLSTPNWRRKSLPAQEGQGKEHIYHYGDNALKTWIDDISQADKFTKEQAENLFFVGWWCFDILCDARDSAAKYLNEHAQIFDVEIKSTLQKAASIYGVQSKMMMETFETHNTFLGPWSGKKFDDWTPEVRKREVELLKEIRRMDNEAIAEIDRAVKLIEVVK